MNPVAYEKDGSRLYCPGLSKMTNEEYTNLMSGSTYKFDYSTADRLFIHGNKIEQQERIYSSDAYKYSISNSKGTSDIKK